jgi:hypothetical protein
VDEIKARLNALASNIKSMRSRCESSQCPQSFDSQFYQQIATSVEQIESACSNESNNVDFNSLNQIVEKYVKIERDLNSKINADIAKFLKLEAERNAKKAQEKLQLEIQATTAAAAEKAAQQKQAEFLQRLKSNEPKLAELSARFQKYTQTLTGTKYKNTQRFQSEQLSQLVKRVADSVNQSARDLTNFMSNEFGRFSSARETDFGEIEKTLSEKLSKFANLDANISTDLKQIDAMLEKCDQEVASKEKEREAAAVAAAAAKAAQEETERVKKAEKDQAKKNAAHNLNENDKQGINSSTLTDHETLQRQFVQFRKESEEALSAPNLKMYRFDLQKAINFPLNTMLEDKEGDLNENRRNFVEKIKTLGRLLSGQTCTITSTLTVNPTRQAKSIDYCLVYLARKIAEKGEETVGNRPETAHQYCRVAIEVIRQIRHFEMVLVGQLQEKCPYVVLFYKSRQPGQTDEQKME